MEKPKVSSTQRLPVWQPLTIRDFLLVFIGESVSLLGDQFYLVPDILHQEILMLFNHLVSNSKPLI